MKKLIKDLSFLCLLLLTACGQREVLIRNSWVLIGGTNQGKPIEFSSNDRVRMFTTDSQNRPSLFFNEDETIILPGINSHDISARWTTDGNEISFALDSNRNFYGVEESEEAMRIYGQTFEYNVSLDTLRLFSKDVKIWAVRDKTFDNLFKNLE